MTTMAKALAVLGLGLSALIPSAAMACDRVGEVVVGSPVVYRPELRRHERVERREHRREERFEHGRFRRF